MKLFQLKPMKLFQLFQQRNNALSEKTLCDNRNNDN